VPQGGTVLDPFVGGGTTAKAAKETGRKCIAVELSLEYAKIATEYLQESS
jgi:site-specific DNA-methyltransferase (adenine-specific)